MDGDRFYALVAQAAGEDRDHAARATSAVLATLAERLSPGEARDLAARLPPEVAPWMATTDPAQRLSLEEFIRRVAEREGTDLPTAERDARAVFSALALAVGEDEWRDMVSQLPSEYAVLLPRGPYVEAWRAERLIGRVAERTGLDEEAARRATEATLEALAERISGGEVEDLKARLPVELHPALDRGDTESNHAARRMSLERFIERIAQREGLHPADALEHARGVLATLREAVGDEEFFDVTVQLPREYDVVLEAPGTSR